jgi:hypothetical protein
MSIQTFKFRVADFIMLIPSLLCVYCGWVYVEIMMVMDCKYVKKFYLDLFYAGNHSKAAYTKFTKVTSHFCYSIKSQKYSFLWVLA